MAEDRRRVQPLPEVMRYPDIRTAAVLGTGITVSRFKELIRETDHLSLDDSRLGITSPPEIPNRETEDCMGRFCLPSQMRGSVAVIAGSASTRDNAFLLAAAEAGAVVFTLGHGIDLDTPAHYWITAHDPVLYPYVPFGRPSVIKILRIAHRESRLWDSRTRSFLKPVKECSNTHFMRTKVESSLLMALEITKQMQFRSVILNGVTLEADLARMYYFPELCSRGHYEERKKRYAVVREQIDEVIDDLYVNHVTVGTTDNVNFGSLPAFTTDYLLGAIRTVTGFGLDILTERFVNYDLKYLREQEDLNRRIKEANVSKHLLELVGVIAQRGLVPKVYQRSIEELQRAHKDPKCPGCTRGKLRRKATEIMTKVLKENESVHEVWEEKYPDHWVFINRGNFIFRRDHSDDEEKWKSMQERTKL
jgi:hypothetical protein